MSTEVERVFSGARRTISWERTHLKSTTIEEVECLKHWLKNGLARQELLPIEDLQQVLQQEVE